MLQNFNHAAEVLGKTEADRLFEAIRGGVFKTEIFKVFKDGIVDEHPFDIQEFKNAYVNAGGALFLDLLMGAGGTAYNNANSYIGVGDSSTATTSGMTDLQAATNKLRKAMDATFPSRSGQVSTWKSTFGTSDANWQWNEVALFNASSAGTMLARGVVASPFTKTAAISVVQSYTITIP